MAADEDAASFETNFFIASAGTLEAETPMSGKTEYFLAVGENKTSFFGVTFFN